MGTETLKKRMFGLTKNFDISFHTLTKQLSAVKNLGKSKEKGLETLLEKEKMPVKGIFFFFYDVSDSFKDICHHISLVYNVISKYS